MINVVVAKFQTDIFVSGSRGQLPSTLQDDGTVKVKGLKMYVDGALLVLDFPSTQTHRALRIGVPLANVVHMVLAPKELE